MNLVSNFIGGISSTPIGATASTGIDLGDKTFSDILEKQLNENTKVSPNTISDYLGIPAGLEIQNLDGSFFNNMDFNQESVDYAKLNKNMPDSDITTSETVTFYNSLLNNKQGQNLHTEVLDFAKKQAANLYLKGSGSVITDLNEFVGDILNS